MHQSQEAAVSPAPGAHGGHPSVGPGSPLRHLAVILDGNRRWARARRVEAVRGYERGGDRALDLLAWAQALPGLEVVTLWPLSTENLTRDPRELEPLLRVITDTAERIEAEGQWRIRIIGRPERLPPHLYHRLRRAEERCRTAARARTVNLAIAYGGRDELARAVARMVVDRPSGGAAISDYLDTAGQPDPDLVIRTGGEQRLSGFMPWQTAYAEFWFCPLPWPDFTRRAFEQAVAHYRTRARTHGR
ncbi:polyprenyl diphosphate synthase [Kitasatospora sp. NPDC057692]|uniref:polyprenyl diphosphate synthase n=1 Tax=Kitasatospora sp. NPDC057692 TaxID=3346215 RepID=UPI0036CAADF3